MQSPERRPAPDGRRRIRVLKLTSYLPRVGGGELQTHALSRTLRQVGVSVTVVDTRGEARIALCDRLDGIPVLRHRTPGVPGLDLLWQQAALQRRLKRLLPRTDIVQVNHLGPALLPAMVMARRHRVPLLLLLWGSCRRGVGPFRSGPTRSLLRAVARRADVVVALSEGMARNLEVLWGFRASRLAVIPNGVDTVRFRPRPGGDPPHGMPPAPVIISVVSLVPTKRYDLLLDAFRSVSARHGDARLALIGDGPQREALERQARESGLAGRVVLAGRRADIETWLSRADIYVSSSDTEGMSNAVLEAMSSGLPVVATRVSGSEDLVVDGATGQLVDAGDPAALAAALSGLLEDAEMRRRLGAAARRRIEEMFSLRAVAERYRATYERLLAGS
jgi:L-malate glycosyltransferase